MKLGQSTANLGGALTAGAALAAGVDLPAEVAAVIEAGGGFAAAFLAANGVMVAGGGFAAGLAAVIDADAGGFAGSLGVEELEVTFGILFGDLGAGAALRLAPAEERGDFNGMARFFAPPCDVDLPFLLLPALG